MPITVNCACGKEYPVKDEFAGHRVKCPDCGQVLTVPGIQAGDPDANGDIVEAAALDDVQDVQLDESPGDVIVTAPKKKSKKGLVLGLLSCGCLVVFLGLGLAGTGVGLVLYYMGAFDDHHVAAIGLASLTEGDKDKDKDNDKTTAPNDKTTAPNKDKEEGPIEKGPPPIADKGAWKGHRAGIAALRFTNDGKYAVTAAGGMEQTPDGKVVLAPDNSIRFWNVADGSEVEAMRVDFKEGIAVAAISPDGHYAAVTYPDKSNDGAMESDHVIHVWDLKAKKELPPLAGHRKDVLCLAFNKIGTELLSGGGEGDNSVRLWKISDGSPQKVFFGHTGKVTGVAFVPNDVARKERDLVVSCSADGSVRLWDPFADNVQQVREFKGHTDGVLAVAVSEDGKGLFTAGGDKDPEIRMWDVASGAEVKRFRGHTKGATCLAVSQDGKRLLSGGGDNVVRLWNVTTSQEMLKFEDHTAAVRGVAFFPDGRHALSGGDDKTLRVGDLPVDIPDIIAKLANPDIKVKQQAVQELSKFGDEAKPAVPALMKCLTVGDVAFRQEVLALIKKLGGTPGRDDVALLATLAADKTFPEGRLFALDGLATLGAAAKPALPALIAMLTEKDAVQKRKAILVIGQIGPDARDQVFKQFVEFLRDPDKETAKAAGEALPKLGKPAKEQIPVLATFLSDANDNVRKYALTALMDLGPDAESATVQIVAVARNDKLPELRKAALATMLALKPKDKLTVDLMTASLKDTDPGVCLQALAALAEIGPSGGALSGLIQALDHKNEDVRKAADEAFAKAAFDKSHVKALATVLGLNKSVKVRMQIVDALGRLKADASDAAEDLGKVAEESQGDLRLKAIRALAELGPAGKKGGPMLVAVMTDKNEKDDNVRIEAALAITKMEAPEAKEALPILIKGLLVTDPTDATQTERQDKVSKVLIEIGKPAADPLAKTLGVSGDFYISNVNTPAGKSAAAARRKVVEILQAMGKKANTGRVLIELADMQRGDPDLDLRKLAGQVRVEIQN